MKPTHRLCKLLARIVQGDATVAASYERLLGGQQAQLLLTDPPYCLLERRRAGGDLRQPRGRKLDHATVVRYESTRQYEHFTRAWLPLALSYCRADASPAAAAGRNDISAPILRGSTAIIWTNVLGKASIVKVAQEAGWCVVGEVLWAKRTKEQSRTPQPQHTPLVTSEVLLRVYETALVLRRHPLPPPRPADPPLPWSITTGYHSATSATVAAAATDGGATTGMLPAITASEHPHEKPPEALLPLIRAWSRPGDLVLDPFCGTGAAPLAAVALHRHVLAMEKDPHWVQIAQQRVQHALREGAGVSSEA